METERKCKSCGKLLNRRNKCGKWESLRDFRKRQFCDKRCSSTFQHSEKNPELKTVEQATEKAATGSAEEKKSAIQILEEAANNEKLDWMTRINAAKALAPYQAKKPGEKGGKKEEAAEKAKQAGAGRFGARPAPTNVIPMKKQG